MMTDFKTVQEILGEQYYNTLSDEYKNLVENNSINKYSITFEFDNGKKLKVTQNVVLEEFIK